MLIKNDTKPETALRDMITMNLLVYLNAVVYPNHL